MVKFKLSNGYEIPQLGFGVFRTPDGETCVNSVKWALEAGYRHVDTAKCYRNEGSVGQALKESGVAREDIFLTTKLWCDDIQALQARQGFENSIKELDVDYVDLYLIHWPVPGRVEAWKEMINIYNEGKAKAIGVSNFTKAQIEELENLGLMLPMVNQIESNPYFQNDELIEYCQSRGIIVEAWSPLGGTGGTIMEDEVLKEIAKKHNRSVAQVILRWHASRGIVVLSKSTHQNRIEENFNCMDFDLDEEDIAKIKSIDRNTRTGGDPEVFAQGFPPKGMGPRPESKKDESR